MLAELTAIADVLPPELPDFTTRKPKRVPKPTPPPKHLIGTANSIVHAQYDEKSERWVYHCIGPAGITAGEPHDQVAGVLVELYPGQAMWMVQGPLQNLLDLLVGQGLQYEQHRARE